MKKRLITCLLCLLLAVALLLQGCHLEQSPIRKKAQTEPAGTKQTETQPDAPATEYGQLPARQQNAGGRDYLPDGEVALVPFDQMVYQRPDVDAIGKRFDALTRSVEEGAKAEEILQEFYNVYDLYYDFYTMSTLANIRYYCNTGDSYYHEEYDFCQAQAPTVEEKLEAFLKACAVSDQKTALEELYFGEDYLEEYVDYAVYTDPDYLALAQQEEAILADYRAALEAPTVFYDGSEQSFWALLEEKQGQNDYINVLKAYYEKYNPIIAGYFVQLVSVRNQLAQVLGYDSYAEYSYDKVYGRDYDWETGKEYVASIREQLVPLYGQLLRSDEYYSLSYGEADEALVRQALSQVAHKLGGSIAEAYDFMIAYDLCDLTKLDEKMDTSFMTYIFSYEVPFVMMNATGTTGDICTFAHEFGHFTDAYVNYHSDEDLETAETFSQSMEYLALSYLEGTLSAGEVEEMQRLKLIDTLETFISQGAFADFEDRVYSLPQEELTVEAVNDTYRQIAKDYGFYYDYLDFYYSACWIDVPHFFESPYYVISYCVSADTALQIYQLEAATPGAGLEKFNTLLGREAGEGVQSVMETAGLENPFAQGRMKEIAQFLADTLELE